MKSLERKGSFSLIFSGDTIFPPFLGFPFCCILSPPRTGPPSVKSVIRPPGRGVKNIMQEGEPAKKMEASLLMSSSY